MNTPLCRLFVMLFLFITRQSLSQCTADIHISTDGIGNYTFTATNISDTSSATQYYWQLNSDTLPADSNKLQAMVHLDSNGTYQVCLHLSDTTNQCLFDTCTNLFVMDAEYFPMLDSVNTWRYRGNLVPLKTDDYPCGFDELQQYTTKDTVINGKTYKELWSESNFGGGLTLDGFISEDITTRKIFFVDVNLSPEILLYDFSMKIGDSININFLNGSSYFSSGNYRLDSIKEVTILTKTHREFFLNCHTCINRNTLTWIDGIGNIGDLVYPYSCNGWGFSFYSAECPGFPHDFDHFMICFEHSSKIYYDDCAYRSSVACDCPSCVQVGDSCNYYGFCAGIPEIASLSSFSVSPNPASIAFSVLLDVKNSDDFTISILNFEGKRIDEMRLGRINGGLYSKEINIANLIPGLYLVECKAASGTLHRKLLVQK